MPDSITLTVLRQDKRDALPYPQEFRIPYEPGMNVISCLQAIALNPVTTHGEQTSPPVYDANCLENVCGSCTMVINGRVRQACNTLVDPLLRDGPVIDIRPMTKFPVIRDLAVDRTRMFDALRRVRAWIPVDSYGFIGEGPRQSPEDQEAMYALSRCMTCGCCLEVCPQVNETSDFIGAAPIAQAVLFNMNPIGQVSSGERLAALMAPGGLSECGNAQNCVKVCPKEVPLTWAIGKAGRSVSLHVLRSWLLK